MPRRKDEAVEEPVAVVDKLRPKPKAATAIFHPDGNVRINLTAPSGREYHIEPREPFEIAGEDVDWFFYEWDWQYRQRLTRVEDYTPPAGYFDATPDGKPKAPGSGVYHDSTLAEAPKTPGSGAYFDATLGTTPTAPSAEYHDSGETSAVITAEEREVRERRAQPEAGETEPVAVEAAADE